jgi:hypothetical protein
MMAQVKEKCSFIKKNKSQCTSYAKSEGLCKKHYKVSTAPKCQYITKSGVGCSLNSKVNEYCNKHFKMSSTPACSYIGKRGAKCKTRSKVDGLCSQHYQKSQRLNCASVTNAGVRCSRYVEDGEVMCMGHLHVCPINVVSIKASEDGARLKLDIHPSYSVEDIINILQENMYVHEEYTPAEEQPEENDVMDTDTVCDPSEVLEI